MVILELIGKGVVRGQLYRLIGSAYSGESPSMIITLFNMVATYRNIIPLESYLNKFDQIYTPFMSITLVLSLATFFLTMIRISPTFKKMIGNPPIVAISAAGIS